MKCPFCDAPDSRVVDSRPSDDDSRIRRRRECPSCGRRFTTYERLGDSPLTVTKSDGSTEVYNREKLFRGIITACAKRPSQIDTAPGGSESGGGPQRHVTCATTLR